jgi:hypothetical protein
MTFFKASILAAVVLAGCSSSASDETGGPSIPLVLSVSPIDGATRVGSAVPLFSMSGLLTKDGTSDPDVVKLQRDIALVTYPEGANVEGAVVAVKPTTLGMDVNLEFRPTLPLSDRWYALTLHVVPARLRSSYTTPYRKMPDGSLQARFRVGSEPSLLVIDLCSKGGTEVGIAFSEPVLSPPTGLPISVTYADGSPAPHCDFSLPTLPAGATSDHPLNPAAAYQALCTDLDPTKVALFALDEGVTTTAGTSAAKATITVDQPSLPISQPACKRWFRSF